ncbi:TonB-dependent receptor [Caulobacter sp. RHG1]|uniref:TonB-dependent receptor n=1 Tax=Caulobacter sp. (strain RHG1) TaxID=2545762 RepID=UPI001553DF71|nr:TonB-dependent receptor [Caulobacter sp. RHG1]NQE60938.1 OmpA-related protein [Caulobacter sp. RHG1]
MNTNSTKGSARSRLLTSTLLAGIATVAAPMAALTVATFAPAVASAQDYQNGTLVGTVNDTSGAPIAGATVVVKSLAQGFERNLTTNSSGEFRAALIPSGGYSVSINKGGFVAANDGNVRVRAGSASNYSFTLAGEGEAVSEIVITGTANPQLDFANTTTGLVVDVETLAKQVPIARNVTALTLLAPSAIPGDSAAAFTQQGQSQAAIGGSSLGENVFYVNGLNITNFVNGIGGATVPFEFYKSVEVKTGGFPAEFGRGTGAMINAVTKSGSNDFTFALHGNYEPNSLREQAPNALTTRNSMSKRTDKSLIVEAGGPIIPDHLFFYGLASFNSLETQSATNIFQPAAGAQSNVSKFRTSDPFYAFKLDGYITDRQHLEFTYFDTSRKQKSDVYRYSLDTDQIVGGRTAANTLYQGGENYVARYTGSFTDWLTVSAAYGRSEVDNANVGNLIGEPLVQDARGSTTTLSRQTAAASTFPFIAEREFYRGDVDLYFKLFGSHHIRAGYDRENTTLTEFTRRNGGYNYIYRRAPAGGALGGLVAANQEYVELRKFETGGGFDGVNKAIYIQDAWDITDRLTLNLGVRRDQFAVADPNGQVFSSFDNEVGLRMGFAYDVFGDRNDKIYGSYGRTFVPVASNTAFRAASPAIDNSQFFLPAGGALAFTNLSTTTGLPTAGLGAQIIGSASNPGTLQPCVAAVGSIAPVNSYACVTRNNGRSPDPEAVAAKNLGSTYQDEYILGYEHRFGPLWRAGVNLTYRTLGRVSEDALLDYGIQNWCLANGYPSVRGASGAGGTGCAAIWGGEHQYLIINPGKDAVITLSDPLPGETQIRTITVTAAQLGFPKVKREYLGLEFNFERSFDGKWGLQGSYVVSESKGNFEGQARSDNGQADAGITVDFDHLAFVPGSYGLLPNHRGHQLKLFGSYALTDNLLFGGNLSVISPRKYGCIGFAPDGSAPDSQVANSSYGAASRYCGSKLVNRGTAFDSDWVTRFDASVRYTVPSKFVPGLPMIGSDDSSLVLRADIFNVFNLKGVSERNEFGESALNTARLDYMAPTTYQTPRSIRFGFDLQF